MKHVKNSKLGIKIIGLLGIVIFLIILIYSIIFTRHYKAYEDRIIGAENISTLHSIEMSVNTVIKNADDYSKMLVADSFIQKQMDSGNLFTNISEQHEVINRIYAVLQFSDSIEAAWLIDNYGEKLTVGSSIAYEDATETTENYSYLQKPYGLSKLLLIESEKKTKLSLVRSYNSLENFTSLGIMGVDIKKEAIEKLVSGTINLRNEQIAILNEEGSIIYRGGVAIEMDQVENMAEELNKDTEELLKNDTIGNIPYMISGVRNGETGWKIIRFTPIQYSSDTSEIIQFNIVLIGLIGILILFGAAAISGMLTTPIQELLICMKDVESGKLTRIKEKSCLQEFKILMRGYNHMVQKIELLIQETIDRQRRIRQVEMNEIQEQMKPHFLYNTLDSIEALAMMGETEKVYRLVEALGDFYRKSVSGGREFLTIKEEFKMAEDYVDIMKIRFGDTFRCHIMLDEACDKYQIPKLTIQPLVENAFQHGIRAKKQFGHIDVKGCLENRQLHILVGDNGGGIPRQIIQELAENKEPAKGKSLGLRGTIERLRQMYGDVFSYKIDCDDMSVIHLFINTEALEKGKVQ